MAWRSSATRWPIPLRLPSVGVTSIATRTVSAVAGAFASPRAFAINDEGSGAGTFRGLGLGLPQQTTTVEACLQPDPTSARSTVCRW